MSTKKDFASLEKTAVAQGWKVLSTNGGHKKWLAPAGGIVISGSTESDPRGIKNHLSRMNKLGFKS
jgi:hypothetical protein